MAHNPATTGDVSMCQYLAGTRTYLLDETLVGGALRVACCLPAHALPAPIARIIALTAPTTLGLSSTPFHEPFDGRGAADSGGLDRVIVDRQGSDADIGRCGAADSPAQWAASTNTYSDALCLALHAISAVRRGYGAQMLHRGFRA